MVLYPTSFTVVLTVVDVPLYFFFLNGEEKSRRISLGKNMKIQDIRSTIHHHQPIVSHQRQPCPCSLYFDFVLDVVTDPRDSWKVFTETFSLPHLGHVIVVFPPCLCDFFQFRCQSSSDGNRSRRYPAFVRLFVLLFTTETILPCRYTRCPPPGMQLFAYSACNLFQCTSSAEGLFWQSYCRRRLSSSADSIPFAFSIRVFNPCVL